MECSELGKHLRIQVYGTSHGPCVGVMIQGYPAGIAVDRAAMERFMARRAPGSSAWTTARREADCPVFLSGLDARGTTDGGDIRIEIKNTDAHSQEYPDLHRFPRPGHADYAANLKYGEGWDDRGGGMFSARLTAPICAAGALCLQYLKETYGIIIAAHIARIGTVTDRKPDLVQPAFPLYAEGHFPVLHAEAGERMLEAIAAAKEAGDSIDGTVRCIIQHVPGGVGGALFEGLEGKLALGLFGIPAVKGVSFGETQMFGSENNDAYFLENGFITTKTNRHGGILGGISSGMPIHFAVDFKPTPSIGIIQKTVDRVEMKETEIALRGRHDPCVVPRAVPVVEAVSTIVLMDVLLQEA